MIDGFHDECGVAAVYGNSEASNHVYLSLYAFQHRGQESAGIASCFPGERFTSHRGRGLVSEVFDEKKLSELKGSIAIGHNRYSTSGKAILENAQPFSIEYARGRLSLAHNGNLVNSHHLRRELEQKGAIFRTTNDSEVLLHLIAHNRHDTFIDVLKSVFSRVRGAYSIVMTDSERVYGMRDPLGIRPLILGELEEGLVLVSESCALDLMGASFVREVNPGELIVIDGKGYESIELLPVPGNTAHCIFEFIYFARPDSYQFGSYVHDVRKELGRTLAREDSTEADVVIPVPDSGIVPTLGYSQESGVPFEMGLIRNHYVGRTFIEPRQSIRHFGVKIKLNPVRSIIEGKRVIVIDDSIVRGTTSRKIIKMIRDCGAKEVHMRIAAPPTICPCFYGVDTPTRTELIAHNHTLDQIRTYITADTLQYLSHEGMFASAKGGKEMFCSACFDGDYPVPFDEHCHMQD
ncbi:amidophosphoribosyltransferase [Desulfurispira natronophila]|uniref:Amidophosphoribosyltransferase n=1 Tax=Desulfurispira natronophila TaxID=682562 RepID=A0A7W8DHX2_9BACT|nr:amidophosphoribosyltransferase [Desulfurispira natronophila]MBB5022905.1 amidophosphoribosyltransferase [Desulfurispira natronophila]